MKVILIFVIFCISLSLAVPPPTSNRYSTLARQQSPPLNTSPYKPTGWSPQGDRFAQPARQTAPAAPNPSYGPPKDVYGVPTTTELMSTTDIDFTEVPDVENFKIQNNKNQQQTAAETVERGQYYLLLPDGRLQKVQYVTSADLQRMAYSAKLRYEDVEPISGPIFTTANNQPFFPIFQKK